MDFFPISHRILCYNPTGQKFCRNRSISYGFQDINIFLFFRKNSRWPPKVAKIEIFQFCIEYFPTTLRVKNSVQIVLSLTVSEILRFFCFSQKFKMAAKSGENGFFFQFHIEYSATTLWVKNSVEIALSLTVSKILTFFRFSQKSKMAAKSGEN